MHNLEWHDHDQFSEANMIRITYTVMRVPMTDAWRGRAYYHGAEYHEAEEMAYDPIGVGHRDAVKDLCEDHYKGFLNPALISSCQDAGNQPRSQTNEQL